MADKWDLEEIPYETNDKAGGYYLHFDPTGETGEEPLYLSKSEVSEANAHLIAAAPSMYEALKGASITLKVLQPQGSALLREIDNAIAKVEHD